MTIGEALDVQHRTISGRDAEVLLGAILKCDRAYLHAHPDQTLKATQQRQYEALIRRREQNEPVAYIIGEKEFYGRVFKTDVRALIPRPETEGMVEQAVTWCKEHFHTHLAATNKPCPVHILELGTGSGAVAVSLALELAQEGVPATITATDIAPKAIHLATENWGRLKEGNPVGNTRLHFLIADLFDHPNIKTTTFDIIVANLPYVESTWRVEGKAQPDVIFHEPEVALFGGADGLDIYRRFFKAVPTHLPPDGAVIIEYGEKQTADLLPLSKAAFPDKKLTVKKDFAGLDRILLIQ